MPTPTKGPRLGGSPAHERLMLANLATSLFKHGRITTTEVKAKRLRPLAEQLITKAKRGDLPARRARRRGRGHAGGRRHRVRGGRGGRAGGAGGRRGRRVLSTPMDEPAAREPGGGLVRVRFDVAYDGTDFSGWAVQPGRRTVAGVLLAELTRVLGTVEGLTVAGRTDAGVHATGQVCHVDVPADAWSRCADTLAPRLAGLLPSDVRVRAAVPVPAGFNARFSALSRRYEYRVTDAPYGADPLRARYTLAWPRPLDLDRLNAA